MNGRAKVFGALLGVSVFGMGFASATSLADIAGTAESVVAPVTKTSASSLPDPVPPPATPAAPVATPAAPQPPVKVPSAAPTSSTSSDVAATLTSATHASSPRGGLPSVDGTARGTTSSASREAAQQVSGSARSSSGANSNRQDKALGRDRTTSGGNEHSIHPAEPAPLRWFFIHVWPAIALGQDGVFSTTLPERLEGTTSFLATDAARLLTGFSGATGPGPNPTPSPSQSAKPTGRLAVPPAVAQAVESYRALIFLALVVLAGLFVAWTESRALSRPH
jgi:hypothetical protein